MSYEFIRVEHLGPVCRIYLNRPEVRNAQSRSLLRELDARGIGFHDLQSSESSLEDIFVSLVSAQT